MKLPRLLPAVLLLAPQLHANHEVILDVSGSVAPMNINLTLNEGVGGYLITEARKEADAARGISYPDRITYDTTYGAIADAASAISNPFGWDNSQGNHYVERISTRNDRDNNPVVTAAGAHNVVRSRYTNATLLEDLVATGRIPDATGYRLVAVQFDLDDEVHYDTGTYNTHVNSRLYFFAERGADDPEPVFIGAEYNDIYIYQQVIGLERTTIVQAGRYTDTFTGDPVEGGFDYRLAALNYTNTSAGHFFFFRPAPGDGAFYRITAHGLIRWTERYDARREEFRLGPLSAGGLTGPAQGYFGETEPDHGMVHNYTPNAGHQAFVTGAVSAGAATNFSSMSKYLNRLPPVMPH